ncbi:MAG: acetyl-CoA C-acyltransferase [Gemmatimonadales bacterium]
MSSDSGPRAARGGNRAADTGAVVFLSAVRTPFGTFGGTLRDVPVTELTTYAAKAAIERAGIEATDIDSTILGNVLYTTADSAYFSRHVALKAGCREESSALTLNRLCGSGFQAVVSGAQEILLGDSAVCLVGGADSMSQAPHVARVRWGVPFGKAPALEDTLWTALTDSYAGLAMAETAENLADKYKLDRSCVDEFALRSQQLARDAWAAGAFDAEIVGVPVRNPKTKQTEIFARDEHMRPDSTLEGLAKLKPVFRENGVVTAGNASGIGDGAGALVIASESFAKERGLSPLGRLISWGIAGVDPKIMGIGPVPAARKALEAAGLGLDDMDLIEVNEAFAPQACAVERELGIKREKLNRQGGAIALSHPLAASGARITAHLLHMLRAEGKRYGLGSACIGGGQGIALIVEAIH